MLSASVLTAPAAFLVSLIMAGFMLRAGVLDHPNKRSSHSNPTPRGGGLGILAGFGAGLALMPGEGGAAIASLVAISALIAATGLADDLFTLDERLKFILFSAASLALAAMIGPADQLPLSADLPLQLPYALALAGTALFVFTTLNAVNFMDGADGVMIACLLPATIALAIIGDPVTQDAARLFAFALAGFALLNAPLLGKRGFLFAGDVGALGAAAIFAGLALMQIRSGQPGDVWLMPLLILPFLADVLLTMAARAKAGERLLSPHRAHAYQLMLRMGASHGQVGLTTAAATVICALLALAAHVSELVWANSAALAAGAVLMSVGHRHVRRRAKARGLDVTQ